MEDETSKGHHLRPSAKAESLDGVDTPDAEDSYHGYLGSTQHDRTDMDRMGKVQELRVSFSIICYLGTILTIDRETSVHCLHLLLR